jgi:transcriptional regulator with XRE-family HTH domain
MATPLRRGKRDEQLRDRLREARRGAGLTQQQVADRLKVSRRAVSEWETGQRRPHFKLPELAELYAVSASYLLEGAEIASVELRELSARIELLAETLTIAIGVVDERVVTLAEKTASVFEAYEQLLRLSNDDPPLRRSDLASGSAQRPRARRDKQAHA